MAFRVHEVRKLAGRNQDMIPPDAQMTKLDLENELVVASALCAAKDAEIERLRKALTAIKEWTLKQDDTVWFDTITQYTLHDLCDQAITAAAEVGPTKDEWMALVHHLEIERERLKQDIADATVKEREACARVAENFNAAGKPIAAAIRAREK
jgi:hypothetical protein